MQSSESLPGTAEASPIPGEAIVRDRINEGIDECLGILADVDVKVLAPIQAVLADALATGMLVDESVISDIRTRIMTAEGVLGKKDCKLTDTIRTKIQEIYASACQLGYEIPGVCDLGIDGVRRPTLPPPEFAPPTCPPGCEPVSASGQIPPGGQFIPPGGGGQDFTKCIPIATDPASGLWYWYREILVPAYLDPRTHKWQCTLAGYEMIEDPNFNCPGQCYRVSTLCDGWKVIYGTVAGLDPALHLPGKPDCSDTTRGKLGVLLPPVGIIPAINDKCPPGYGLGGTGDAGDFCTPLNLQGIPPPTQINPPCPPPTVICPAAPPCPPCPDVNVNVNVQGGNAPPCPPCPAPLVACGDTYVYPNIAVEVPPPIINFSCPQPVINVPPCPPTSVTVKEGEEKEQPPPQEEFPLTLDEHGNWFFGGADRPEVKDLAQFFGDKLPTIDTYPDFDALEQFLSQFWTTV